MSSHMPSSTPGDALALPADTLDGRVRRLERLLDAFDRRRSPEAAVGGLPGDAAAAAIRRLSIISDRLGGLVQELEPRVEAGASDGGDALTSRLLLHELKEALHDCRIIAAETDNRLDRANAAIKEAGRLLDREAARVSASATNA